MNIFATDYSPIKAAQNLADVHVIKMTLESAQLLCTYLDSIGVDTPYKPTHKNHPCNIWVRQNQCNLLWLYAHFKALLKEYTHRYNKQHKCSELLPLFNEFFGFMDDVSNLSPFVLCMPDEYKKEDTVQSYRAYYISKQFTMKRPMRWTNREKPTWFTV